jgi:hypothetical protein
MEDERQSNERQDSANSVARSSARADYANRQKEQAQSDTAQARSDTAQAKSDTAQAQSDMARNQDRNAEDQRNSAEAQARSRTRADDANRDKELAQSDLLDEILALARTPISQTGDRMNGQVAAYELAAKMGGFITNKIEVNDVTKRLHGKSADELLSALKLAPNDYDVSYTLGLVYLKQRQIAPAKRLLREGWRQS